MLSRRSGYKSFHQEVKGNIGLGESALDLKSKDQGLNTSSFYYNYGYHLGYFGNVTSLLLALSLHLLGKSKHCILPEDDEKIFCELLPRIIFMLKLNSFFSDNF